VLFRRRKKRPPQSPRLARLRPEYASLYPRVRPDQWFLAHKVVQKLHMERPTTRPLDDEHFEFRGGIPRNPAWPELRQRQSDSFPATETPAERLARLRLEAASRYPTLVAGIWRNARQITEELLELRRAAIVSGWRPSEPVLEPQQRAVPDADFEFQQGVSEPGHQGLRTRRADLLQVEREERQWRDRLRALVEA
jgi:hypothetical protein